MARTKNEKGNEMVDFNKAEAIRTAMLAIGPEAKASQVQEWVQKKHRVSIPDNYLHVAVSNARKKLFSGESSESPKPRKTDKKETVKPSEGAVKQILTLAKEEKDLHALLSTVRRLKTVNLVTAENILQEICDVQEIVGDKDKAIQVYEKVS